MNAARKALMVVLGEDGPPTIEGVAKQLSVSPSAIDPEFGIVPIDPVAQTYSVLVEMSEGVAKNERSFSNPKIGPFPTN